MSEEGACACLVVNYTPDMLNNKLMVENWRCTSCGSEFMRAGAKIHEAEQLSIFRHKSIAQEAIIGKLREQLK